jgi:hypothetical protein
MTKAEKPRPDKAVKNKTPKKKNKKLKQNITDLCDEVRCNSGNANVKTRISK